MIAMVFKELLDGLARANVWLADGTFKVVPSVFFQLFSVHFSVRSGINPAAVHCLLTNKCGGAYTQILHDLKILIAFAFLKTLLVNLKRAAMNTFSSTYLNATVMGCYFQLFQGVIRLTYPLLKKSSHFKQT